MCRFDDCFSCIVDFLLVKNLTDASVSKVRNRCGEVRVNNTVLISLETHEQEPYNYSYARKVLYCTVLYCTSMSVLSKYNNNIYTRLGNCLCSHK